MKKILLTISGMHCAACVSRIEKVTAKMDGVDEASVNLITGRGEFWCDETKVSEADLVSRIEKLGFGASAAVDSEEAERREERKRRLLLVIAGLLWAPMVAGMLGEMTGTFPQLPPLWQCLLAAAAQFGPGMLFYRGAFFAVRSGALTMDVLVALGTSVAFFYSLWMMMRGMPHLYFETSAGLIFFYFVWKMARRGGETTDGLGYPRIVETLAADGAHLGRSHLRRKAGEIHCGRRSASRPHRRSDSGGRCHHGGNDDRR